MATIDAWLPKAHQLDEHALSEIYQALSPCLYRYAYRLLHSRCRRHCTKRFTVCYWFLRRQRAATALVCVSHCSAQPDHRHAAGQPDMPFDGAGGENDSPRFAPIHSYASEARCGAHAGAAVVIT
jgi:hypothetical protein